MFDINGQKGQFSNCPYLKMKFNLEIIWPILAKNKIILLGELHGARESIDIIEEFVDIFTNKKIQFIIGFEWPEDIEKEINLYLINKSKQLNWRKWEFLSHKDGRFSLDHVDLLKKLRKLNQKLPPKLAIKAFCFDYVSEDWNKRDKRMAERIRTVSSIFPGKKILAVMGRIHAAKKGKEPYKPLATHLKNRQIVSICIKYGSGRFQNMGLRFVKGDKYKIKKAKLIKDNKNFDYKVLIPVAHPVKILT